MNLKKFQTWAEQEHSSQKRLLLVIPALIGFCLVLPFLFVTASTAMDRYFQWPSFKWGNFNIVIGVICVVIGGWLGLWTVRIQFILGKGTPAPFMPTRTLIILGPYKFCRNPMIFGVFLAYLGLGIWTATASGAIMALLFLWVASVYIKEVEEKELEIRFGADYMNYKKTTPFLLPAFKKRT